MHIAAFLPPLPDLILVRCVWGMRIFCRPHPQPLSHRVGARRCALPLSRRAGERGTKGVRATQRVHPTALALGKLCLRRGLNA
jgi:hypothetical protein